MIENIDYVDIRTWTVFEHKKIYILEYNYVYDRFVVQYGKGVWEVYNGSFPFFINDLYEYLIKLFGKRFNIKNKQLSFDLLFE